MLLAEPLRMLFCSHGNHFEGASMQLYITMYFLYKQKCSLLKNRVKENVVTALCGQGPHMWVTRQQSSPPALRPLPQPCLLPAGDSGLAGQRVEEEMFFAF